MSGSRISDVARQSGFRASAIRYYERIGLLPAAHRVNGQRRYEPTVLHRLAVVRRARRMGFALSEIRHLFFGAPTASRASDRWRALSRRRLAELDDLMEELKAVRRSLLKMMTDCRCETLEQCGRAMLQNDRRGS